MQFKVGDRVRIPLYDGSFRTGEVIDITHSEYLGYLYHIKHPVSKQISQMTIRELEREPEVDSAPPDDESLTSRYDRPSL